ncbi:hypothetical protein CYMTET_12062 [Cymbomonas tetramitiformis]|uniref:Uncharacterized protein n=1 Tax=Cymbomonas tetramitiformis TaxID=36881 RepID=A0AAE0LCU2_9CHLO|nr:hypothetical protein CYMTET_12062 [Cymbomonas tetramitiformis]
MSQGLKELPKESTSSKVEKYLDGAATARAEDDTCAKEKDAAEKEKSTNLSTGFVAAFEAEVREAYIEGQGEEAAAVSVSLPSGRVVSREDAAVGEEEATAGEEGAAAGKEDAMRKEKDVAAGERRLRGRILRGRKITAGRKNVAAGGGAAARRAALAEEGYLVGSENEDAAGNEAAAAGNVEATAATTMEELGAGDAEDALETPLQRLEVGALVPKEVAVEDWREFLSRKVSSGAIAKVSASLPAPVAYAEKSGGGTRLGTWVGAHRVGGREELCGGAGGSG